MASARSLDSFASKLSAFKAKGGTNVLSHGDLEAGSGVSSASSSGSWLSKFSAATGLQIPDAVANGVREATLAGSELSNMFGVNQGLASVASMSVKMKSAARTAATTVQENAISRQRWTYFFAGAAIGVGLISLAFMFLPMIVFAPQKFALLFTLGSLSFMGSFSALRGHVAFGRHLMSRERLPFSATYVLSMVGTLWAALVYRSYILTVIFSGVQVAALSWFLLSYIPGGKKALGFAWAMAWRLAKGCCQLASK